MDRVTGIYDKVMSNPKINKANKKLLSNFVVFLQGQSKALRTQERYIYTYSKLMQLIDPKIDLLKATKEDIIVIISKLEGMKNLNDETKSKVKVTLKVMFKHFIGEDEYYPKPVAWIKTTPKHRNKLVAEDLLTSIEIASMIKNTKNMRDQAIIALCSECPLRSHELLALKRKHVNLTANPPYISIPEETKTGARRIPFIKSTPYMSRYLDSIGDLEPNDPLFLHEVTIKNGKEKLPLTYAALRMMLKKVAKRAKIKKRIYPYLLRHGTITKYANVLSNAQLETIAGWRHGTTQMHDTYEHLSNTDIDNAILQANGLKTTENDDVKAVQCPRCQFANSGSFGNFCQRCGSPLSLEVALNIQKLEKLAIKSAAKPEVTDEMVEAYIKEKYLKKKGK
jgi:integrase/recombinase XerD